MVEDKSGLSFGFFELPPDWMEMSLEDEGLDAFAKLLGLEGDLLKFSLIADYDEGITSISPEDMGGIKEKIDKSDHDFWL